MTIDAVAIDEQRVVKPNRSIRTFIRATIPWLLLLLCALGSLALYALLIILAADLIPSERSFAEQVIPEAQIALNGSCLEICAELDLPSAIAIHSAASVNFLLAALGLFCLYGLALWVASNRSSVGLSMVASIAGATFLALMLASPALLSGDVFSYIIYGRITTFYGGDPHVEIPASFPNDPYLRYVFWSHDPSYYGPVWTLVSSWLVYWGGEQVGLTVLLFRTAAIAATLMSGILIWWSLARVWPQRALQGLVLFLWNPLIVLEAGLSAHNDAFMLMVVVVAVALYLARQYALGAAGLLLSVLVKAVAAPLLPLYVPTVLRQIQSWWRRAAFLIASGVLCALLVGWTVWFNGEELEISNIGSLGVSTNRYQNSLHELAFNLMRQAPGREPEWDDVPAHFEPYWLGTHATAELWSDVQPIGLVRQWSTLLALSPQRGEWLRVYELATGRIGYIRASTAGPLPRPAGPLDETAKRLEAGPARSEEAVEANNLLRLFGWAGFAIVWIVAARTSHDRRTFLVASTAVFLAYYWLAAAWIWPWYVTWAIALAAFVPDARIAGLAVILSACVLTLYATLGFEGADEHWIYAYRAVPALAMPLVLWFLGMAGLWSWARIRRAVFKPLAAS